MPFWKGKGRIVFRSLYFTDGPNRFTATKCGIFYIRENLRKYLIFY